MAKKNGRPSKYEDWMPEKVTELMTQGKTKAHICADLGITFETFTQWVDPKGDYYKPLFSEAVKKGEARQQSWWIDRGMQAIINGDNKFPASTWIFAMKNICKWTDKQEIEANLGGDVRIVGLPGINVDRV